MSTLATQAQVLAPRPSPASTLTQDLGLTEVKVEYFRPKMNGRKIFGDGSSFVVPFGELWRTGANGGTKITFSDTVKAGGTTVAPGQYLLITKPGKDQWEVILYADPTLGSNLSAMKPEKVV
ncbi:MAG: DUF2911 domain-containing protein, partial [Cytophagales bacterium]|nr:DUF2911 domain-containing protein [Cytophagales bacterium]